MLGALEIWPERRKGIIDALLTNALPMCIFWGPEQLWMYNDACGLLLGSRHPAAFARPLRDVLPEAWPMIQPWLARAQQGESLQLEDTELPLARGAALQTAWFTFSLAALSDVDGVSAILGSAVETTERVRGMREPRALESQQLSAATIRASADATLVANETRQAFLLRLNDALRPLNDPLQIKGEACRMLGEELGTDRTYYADVDHRRQRYVVEQDYVRGDAPSVAGTHPMAGAPQVLQALLERRTLSTDDVEADPRMDATERLRCSALSIRSYVLVPIVKRDEVLAVMCVADVGPRRWAAHEVGQLEDVAERTWDAVQRAQVESVLRESESRLRVFSELAPALLSETDPNGLRTSVNRRWLEYTGQTQEQSRGWGWLAAIHPQDRAASEQALRASLASERPLECEHRVLGRDGDYRWFLVRQQPLRDEQGCVVRWLGVSTDVHDQRLALEAARSARADAEQANRIKDEFLGTLSHELRTPLAAILLWVQALRSQALGPGDVSRAIEAIASSAGSQSRLIEDLLDLSRLASGKLVLCMAPVDVGKVARAALDMVRPAALAKHIELASDMPSDVGTATLDAARLQQILCNLLDNATKFTPEGGTVTLRVFRRDARLELEVADTGQGMSAEFMPRLFQKFSQADMGNARQHAGLGIGLALTKQLVELHGGSITAESAGHGRGSLFRVQLPWATPAASSEREPPYANGAPSAIPLAGLRVLVLEDDTNTLDAMQATLTTAGATVITARTVSAALAALSERDGADVIVSDIGLPGTSGLEFISRVVEDYRQAGREPPPSCALSAYAQDLDRQRGIDAGFDIYLTKPVSATRLVEAVIDLRDIAASWRA